MGRATHVHAKVFPEWVPHPNGTFAAGRLSHVGQFFFEDEINLVIDKVCILLLFHIYHLKVVLPFFQYK